MLITKNFVLLNFPKTGSSFARTVLKQIHKQRDRGLRKRLIRLGLSGPSLKEIILPHINLRHEPFGYNDQHGKYFQIPEGERHKRIVSIVRDPLSRMVSTYHFRWWVEYPPVPEEVLREHYPSFPDLSFRDYYYMMQVHRVEDSLCGIRPAAVLGNISFLFILYYYPDPAAMFERIDEEYIDKNPRRDLPDITFLHQENLNAELAAFLRKSGYSKKEARVAEETNPVNVTEKDAAEKRKSVLDYYDPEMLEDIVRRDRFFYTLFPDYLPLISNKTGEASTRQADAAPVTKA